MGTNIETVRTDRFSMRYFRFGQGERTLVILPGLSIQSVMLVARMVEKEYEIMKNDFTVYVFDRREDLPEAYPVREMARDTAEAICALGLRDICLFGASQGGMIVQVIAIEHPDLIDKLVLASTSSCVGEEEIRVIENWIRLAEARDGVGLYLDSGEKIYPPSVFEESRPAIEAAGKTVTEEEFARFLILAEGIRGFDVRDEVGRIACPVLVIGSHDDAVLGGQAAEDIAKRLGPRPDVKLHMYDGYGHVAYDTAPDCRERIHRFFTDGE